jgi:branched-chain amino acid transport system substrate-binding protein
VLSTSEQYLAESINLAAENAGAVGKKAGDLRVALAMENDPFSQDIRAGVIDDAKKHGMDIVVDDKLPKELNDMTATLTKVKALKPDILVVSGHSKGAALAIRQIDEMKVDVPMLAMTHCEAAKVQDKFPGKSDYTLCATQWASTLSYSDKWFGTAAEYADLFRKTYEGYTVVPYQAAESTASVLVYVDALERAGSLDQGAVRDALAATDMQTFYGNIKFSPAGNNVAKPMVLRQIIDGKYVVVAPSKWAEKKVTFPMPTWDKR